MAPMFEAQDDVGFALTEMKAETLSQIETALRRVVEGRYGYCFERGDETCSISRRATADDGRSSVHAAASAETHPIAVADGMDVGRPRRAPVRPILKKDSS